MLKYFTAFIFLTFMLFQTVAQDYSIHAIQIDGLETVSRETFLDIVDIDTDELPRNLTRTDIVNMERSLRVSNYFQTFRIEYEDNVLFFNVRENPYLGDIEITGNTIISTRRIRNAVKRKLREEKLDTYYSFQSEALIRQSVLGLYHRRRLLNVEVNIVETIDNNTVDLTIEVDERDHYQVGRINFTGNENYHKWRLVRKMDTAAIFSLRKRYYYPELLQRDRGEIVQFYHDEGYLDVALEMDVEIDEENRKADINIFIDEGTQYNWESLEIYGNTLFTDDEIRAQLRQLEQDSFSYSLWKKSDASRVFDLYANEGFINTNVETDFIRNERSVDLVLNIIEGDRFEVGNIMVTRPPLDLEDLSFWEKLSLIISPPVEEDIIRKYFRVQEGDIYKKHRVQRGYFNLMNSNLFERVDLAGEPTPFQQETTDHLQNTLPGALGEPSPTEPYTRDIDLQLEEKATGQLILSAGYGEDIGVFGQVHLREENFRGKGHVFSLAGTFASKYHSIYGSYYVPFFRGNVEQSLLLKAYSSLYQRSEYDETRRGVEIEIGNEINDYLTWYWGFKLIQVGMDPDSSLRVGENITARTYRHIDRDFDSYFLIGPSIGLREDTRDSYTFPTRGYVQHYNLDLYALGGEVLPTLSADYRWFYPLSSRYVWANNLVLDWVTRDIDDIPLPERYYLGGLRSVRGYGFRGIIPKDDLNKDLPLGGAGRVLAKTEIRRRITEQFSIAGFLDAGVLGHKHLLDWKDPWKFGTGIQFAFHLPIGNISIDIAHALNPDSRDKRQTVHFNLGFNF